MSVFIPSLARRVRDETLNAPPESRDFEDPLVKTGRRGAPRLRLSIPAKLITVSETRRCVLLDVSRTGARIGIAKPLDVGDAGFLRFADFEVFGCAIRKEDGRNGLEFDIELSDEDVLATRHYAETCQMSERDALLEQARLWVLGYNSD